MGWLFVPQNPYWPVREVIKVNLAFGGLVLSGKDLKLSLKMVISVPFLHLKLKSKEVLCGLVVP